MAGTAKAYDATKILIGPCDVWAKVAVPSANARATIDTTSSVHTPDSTAHPTAKHLGMSKNGAVISYKPEIQDFSADELTAPFLSRITGEALSIKIDGFQVFDWDLLELMTVGGTKSTGSGYEQLQIGGQSAITTYSILVICPDVTTPGTYYTVAQLYKAYNKAGWELPITRKEPSSMAVEFTGQAITTRATGDQIGNIWKKVV